jgi:hypothetical protein
MISYQGASVNNPGYFDVPICNSLSNREYRDPSQNIGQYELNQHINQTINDNNAAYTVYQRPTVPSQSLYIESDVPASPYYQQSFTKGNNYPPLIVKKKEMVPYQNEIIENFEDATVYDGYNSGSCLGYSPINNTSVFVPNNMVQRSRYVNHANRDYNQFLNISSMPNISSFYVNNPNVQNPNMVQPQVQQMQLQQNPYNIPRPVMNNYMVPDNQIMNKQIEYPKKIVRMDDDSVAQKRARSKKSKEESEDVDKKSSSKDKSNNVLFYITIILLCVVIIILLMKSMKR